MFGFLVAGPRDRADSIVVPESAPGGYTRLQRRRHHQLVVRNSIRYALAYKHDEHYFIASHTYSRTLLPCRRVIIIEAAGSTCLDNATATAIRLSLVERRARSLGRTSFHARTATV